MMRAISVAFLLASLGCGGAQQQPAAALPTQDQFKAAALGKTGAEVRKVLGKPRGTYESDDGTSSWVYYDRAFDPATGRVVQMQWVDFSKANVCTGVRFQ